MTGQRSFLFDYVERFEGYVKTADKTLRPMVGYGKITDGKYIIKDVRYVEGLGFNMFRSSQFCDNGYWVKQFQYGSNVNDEDNNVILSARRNGNLYSTVFRSIPQTHPQFAAISDPRNAICLLAKASKEDSWLWHRRLCHQNFKDMNKLVSKNLVKGLLETRLSKDTLCPACEQGKMTRSSHPPRMDTSSKSPLDMIHMDLCGPTRTESLAIKKYMLVLVDEFSRFTWVEFLRAKSDAADRIIAFIKRIQVLLGRRVKKLRSDNGTEFRNAKLQSFLEDVGISHNFSAVRTPQQNGVVERKNRTLVEAARSMMAHSGVPQSFWAEAVSTACYTQNRTLIVKRTGKTAYEMVEQRKPNIDYFRVFGCKCYVLNDRDDLGKFEPKSDESIFIGYSHNSKAYRVFNKRTRTILESSNVDFSETETYSVASSKHTPSDRREPDDEATESEQVDYGSDSEFQLSEPAKGGKAKVIDVDEATSSFNDDRISGDPVLAEDLASDDRTVGREEEGEAEVATGWGRLETVVPHTLSPSTTEATHTQTGHSLTSGQDASRQLAHLHTPTDHSAISQQMVVSSSHGELAQLPPTTHLESVGVEMREEPPRLSTSFRAPVVLEPVTETFRVIHLDRTLIGASSASPSGEAGTGRVGASTDALRGSTGSPDTVNIIPAVTSGRESTSIGLFSSTGAQVAPGVVLPGLGPTDSSKVSKDAHATPGLLGLTDSGGILKTAPAPTGLLGPTDSDDILKVVQSRLLAVEEPNRARDARVEALEKFLAETERKRLADLEASRKLQEDRDAELYELKRKIKGKHSEAAPSSETPIPRQTEDVLRLAPPTSGELPPMPGYVTETEHAFVISSYTAQNDRLSAQVRDQEAQIEILQQRVRELEAMCRSQAQPSKRRHDDPDDSAPGPHEGEVQASSKRPRTDLHSASGSGSTPAPASTAAPSSAPTETAAADAPYVDSDTEDIPDMGSWRYERIPGGESVQFPQMTDTAQIEVVLPEAAPTDPSEFQIPEAARKILRSLAQSLRIYQKGDDIVRDSDYSNLSAAFVFPTPDAPRTIHTTDPETAAPTVIQLNWNHSVIFRPFLEESFTRIYQQEKLHAWSRKVYFGISHIKTKRRRTAYVHQRMCNWATHGHQRIRRRFTKVTAMRPYRHGHQLFLEYDVRMYGTGVPRGELQNWTFTEADLDRVHLEDLLTLIKYLQGPILRPEHYRDGTEILKKYVRHAISLARVTDYQLAIESRQPKVNLLRPNLLVPGIDAYIPYMPTRIPEHGVLYMTRKKKERRFMRFGELSKFCDGTLLYVYNGMQSRLLADQIPSQRIIDGKGKLLEAMRLIERKLKERLMYRRVEAAMQMRARIIDEWEEYLQMSNNEVYRVQCYKAPVGHTATHSNRDMLTFEEEQLFIILLFWYLRRKRNSSMRIERVRDNNSAMSGHAYTQELLHGSSLQCQELMCMSRQAYVLLCGHFRQRGWVKVLVIMCRS
ncbi:hypothetical protein OSB04_002471 [Centaurea solstitialis]|uniref:Integrase catalytic domain-containing protein n=1 Tax=Centaurea solstitialis TaxID=347529 RepID=A0AA38TT24_9ASTR|nr:hypothetical protein OSB04_002471 [Centaurea solstitialis]